MYKISKSYVHLLGSALGHKYPYVDQLDASFMVKSDEYIDITFVYEWLADLAVKMGDPDLGLKVFNNSHPAMLGILGYAVMSCATLGQALERFVTYHALISDGSLLKLEFQEQFIKLIGFEIGCKAPRAFIDSGAAVVLSLIKWLVPDRQLSLLRVELVYPEPEKLDELKAVFGHEIKFSAALNSLMFPREIYDYPLISASPTLDSIHSDLLGAQLQKVVGGLMSVRVKKIIKDELFAGCIPTLKSTARRLKVSSRTLQYALQSEGLCFTAVFDGARKELAHYLLKHTRYSLKYVCATLGYCERSSFHKSSLRWFDMTPQQYRNNMDLRVSS